jgi:hypothetical protein
MTALIRVAGQPGAGPPNAAHGELRSTASGSGIAIGGHSASHATSIAYDHRRR